MFHKTLEYALVGDNVGVLLRGVKKDEASRGDVLTKPGRIIPIDVFTATAYLLSKKEGGRHTGISSNYKPQFFFNTLNITGKIELSNRDIVMPGEHTDMVVFLVNKAPVTIGLNFVVREGNLTVGCGIVTVVGLC